MRERLPDNCEIEVLDGDDSFRLWFHGEGEPYVSEAYSKFSGETVNDAALSICRRFGWIDRAPNTEVA